MARVKLQRFPFKTTRLFKTLLLSMISIWFAACAPLGTYNLLPQDVGADKVEKVPLDPASPWPKFRANPLQNGRTDVIPSLSNLSPWEYKTGKGIFSSPVVDADGTVYIGSADHYFYAIRQNGQLKWKFATGEIIDSSALLDDKGRVYFGSGDGFVYALDRNDGQLLWKFKSHTPQEVQEQFGITTYNVNWFEGNIAMLQDGTLLACNDNYLVYAIDRDTGKSKGQYFGNEMIWSLPAVNTVTGRIFFGSTFIALKNTFCYDAKSGKKIWSRGGLGSNAASCLLTSNDPNGALIIGGFDGILRARTQKSGGQLWKFGARDHIYGSPAQQKDGTIIQAAADGTVYALNPLDGSVKWAFDTLEPIRSSPAIDANGTIYVGSGEGKLFCINPDGTLRWAYQCILEERNDLNASPALGRDGVYIAGESGGIFFIPYDYPLTAAGKNDSRCTLGPNEMLPEEGNYLFYTTRFGALMLTPPEEIDANEPLTFSLFIRKDGDSVLSAIDKKSLSCSFSGSQKALVNVSADRRFLTIVPQEKWAGPEGGELKIHIRGDYITDLSRFGLKFFWGDKGGEFDQTFNFQVRARKGGSNPYKIPEKSGDPSTTFEISRLAIPYPTMMPSWNQIGFDSLHYLVGMVEGTGSQAVTWVVPGKLDEKTGKTVVDPSLYDVFPLSMDYDNGLVTLSNYNGFEISFVGSWDMPVGLYRVATKADPESGKMIRSGALNTLARGDDIRFYGKFLKLMGLSDFKTGLMHIYGGLNFNLWEKGYVEAPQGVGQVKLEVGPKSATLVVDGGSLKKDEHIFGLLLIDAQTGKSIPANYARKTRVEADSAGNVNRIVLEYEKDLVKRKVRAYYMIDTYPAFRVETDVKS